MEGFEEGLIRKIRNPVSIGRFLLKSIAQNHSVTCYFLLIVGVSKFNYWRDTMTIKIFSLHISWTFNHSSINLLKKTSLMMEITFFLSLS